MEHWADIHRRILIEGTSKRQVLRETGMHWKTLKKILENSTPLGYRQARPRAKRKLGPYVWRIEQILKEDKGMPKKQRHTAKRIFERLRQEGYEGGYLREIAPGRLRPTPDGVYRDQHGNPVKVGSDGLRPGDILHFGLQVSIFRGHSGTSSDLTVNDLVLESWGSTPHVTTIQECGFSRYPVRVMRWICPRE